MNAPSRKKNTQVSPGERELTLLRLYVADGTPNSARARANLQSICQRYLQGRHKTEVVDILQAQLRALSDRTTVLLALGLEEGTE